VPAEQLRERGKRTNSQVSFEILEDTLHKYLGAVKYAKTQFLSPLVANITQRPQVLFKVFNSLVNPCETVCAVPSTLLSENFLKYFTDKISGLSFSSPTSTSDPSVHTLCPAVLQQFEPVTLHGHSDVQ